MQITTLLDLPVNVADVMPHTYHSGKGRRSRDVELEHRRIIAWDGEGINVSGPDRPQHYVLFGCSADLDNPLIGTDLHVGDILEYICKIGEQYPSAVHIGYGFRYDSNMIVRHLPVARLMELKDNGETYYTHKDFRYRISWLPGKRFQVTQRKVGEKETKRNYVTVRIDDVVAFFAAPFISAVENILADTMSDADREVVAHGKAQRGQNTWEDMPDVVRYWRAEIQLMERLGIRFREVMFTAGFMLRDWYGPGALSSYLIRTNGLRKHIVNGPPDLPKPVHQASKHAYAGGRFELFRMGRFTGPVHSLDINSAYPYAMSKAPSLGDEHGFWQHVESPNSIAYFGVYRIRLHAPGARPFDSRAMPLFHRDYKGGVSYPNVTHGWYWSPEAAVVAGNQGVEIVEGWEWINDGNRPFLFLQEMFNRRLEIGKKNVMSMPFKLGPNSMYGKFAQRVGFTTDDSGTHHAPKSHCLPLAGWVTSYCRAMLFGIIKQIPTDKLIAVETDGIYTTHDVSNLVGVTMGDGLGEWDATTYDEMLYVQNGVYHRRKGTDWLAAKSRGLDVAAVSLPIISDYLRECLPGQFPTLSVTMRPRFIGLTAAAASTAPLKFRHCKWEGGTRELEPGGKGKRVHIPETCPACANGNTAYDEPHELVIRSRSMGEMSFPHFLPWETGQQYTESQEIENLDEISADWVGA